MTLDLEAIAKADAEAVAARRALALEELAAQGYDYSQYDEEDSPATSPGAPGDPEAGRSSRTAKTTNARSTKQKDQGTAAPRSASQRADDQRRRDAAEAANWTRNRSA